MSAVPRELAEGHMTIWEHLAELRSRLIKAIVAVLVGMVVGWLVYPNVLTLLLGPYREIKPDAQLFVTDPLELFTVRLQVSAYIGIALAMPVILWQVWRFVTPALYPHEKRYAVPFVLSSLVLFAFGAALAYWSLTPALEFLLGLGGDNIEEIFSQEKYLTLTTYMMLAFGAGFEVPVLLVALQMIGVLTPRQLLGFWRMAIVIIAVVAAVITPSGDPITMLALVTPMTILYFGSIAIGALFNWRKGRKQRRAAAGSAT
ncbi:MAG: twin-arginine translocase subunit TatC [Acidimicrobiales bacterium]|jgi:sec-independent protein translocase protein TatC